MARDIDFVSWDSSLNRYIKKGRKRNTEVLNDQEKTFRSPWMVHRAGQSYADRRLRGCSWEEPSLAFRGRKLLIPRSCTRGLWDSRCSSLLSAINTSPQSKLRKDRFILHVTGFKEAWAVAQGRNPRQEMTQRSWENAAHWPAPGSMLSCRSNTAQLELPKDSSTHGGLGLPASISNRENVPPTCLWVNRTKATLSVSYPFSQMCHTDG